VKKAISDLKQEVTTALLQIQTLQSEDGTIMYDPNQAKHVKSNNSQAQPNNVAKPELQHKQSRSSNKGSATSLISTSDNEGTAAAKSS